MMTSFNKNPKQVEAIRMMAIYKYLLLEGGSRSGKTTIALYAILIRACKYVGSKHMVVRKFGNHLNSIIHESMPKLLKKAFPTLVIKYNKTEKYYTLSNGSQIWLGGTDDKERIEKLLGWEWETIFINEASQLAYDTYGLLKTRLNPEGGVKPLMLIDYNPPSTSHWGYVVFHKKLEYISKQPLVNVEKYGKIQLNPIDNKENLSDTYLDTLEELSEKMKRRFLYGYYSDDSEFALWKRDWITKNRIKVNPKDLKVVVVGVDPAVTGKETSDDTGIIVAASYMIDKEQHYCVIRDDTYHGDVSGWGEQVVKSYQETMSDVIVGETNQGGDLVEMNIRNYDRNIKYRGVRATRGKAVRAEPIADLYRRGLVHHVGEFPELEDQMCTWTTESDESPNNMDALVWALSYLSGIGMKEAKISRW